MQTLKDKKDYQEFLNTVAEFTAALAKISSREELSYDENEIRVVSDFFIESYKNNLFDLYQRKMFIVYLGEAFKRRYGGVWNYNTVRKDPAYNEPVITKYENEGIRFCPMEHVNSIFESKNADKFNETLAYREEMITKTEAVFAELFPKKKKK